MEPELSAKYPELRTYAGTGIDDPHASLRMDWTPNGLSVTILTVGESVLIRPHTPGERTYHIIYRWRDVPVGEWSCDVEGEVLSAPPTKAEARPKAGPYSAGTTVRLFRLAVATSGEYGQNHGGTVAAVLNDVVTRVNSLNALYERDFSIRLVLVGNNDLILYTDPASDPYLDNNTSELATNQSTIDAVIGSANYDVGHLFLANYGGGVHPRIGVQCELQGQGSERRRLLLRPRDGPPVLLRPHLELGLVRHQLPRPVRGRLGLRAGLGKHHHGLPG
jgi:hypothetical protein